MRCNVIRLAVFFQLIIMRFIFKTITIMLLVFTAWHTSAQSRDSVIVNNDLLLQFTAPAGWHISQREDGYLLSSPKTSGFMLISIQNFRTIKSLKTAMENGIEQANGSKMMPLEDLSMLGNQGVAGLYGGKIDDTEMTGYLMALMPPSKTRAVICISVAPQELFNQSNLDQLKILLRSVIFL